MNFFSILFYLLQITNSSNTFTTLTGTEAQFLSMITLPNHSDIHFRPRAAKNSYKIVMMTLVKLRFDTLSRVKKTSVSIFFLTWKYKSQFSSQILCNLLLAFGLFGFISSQVMKLDFLSRSSPKSTHHFPLRFYRTCNSQFFYFSVQLSTFRMVSEAEGFKLTTSRTWVFCLKH